MLGIPIGNPAREPHMSGHRRFKNTTKIQRKEPRNTALFLRVVSVSCVCSLGITICHAQQKYGSECCKDSVPLQ